MKFKKIRWKNLFSYGKTWTEVDLDCNKTINIIGSNGQGKSVFVEAVYLALTGKPLRKCKKSQVVNLTNKKNCLIEMTAESNGNEYLIRRGIKPNVFEIEKNGDPIDERAMMTDTQTYLETVLGFTKKNLKHTLFMSTTDYTPFLRLPAADKRLFIEDILSIEIFSIMNKLVKAKLSILKEEIRDNDTELDKLQYKLNMVLEYNKQQQETNDDDIAELKQNIDIEQKSLEEDIQSLKLISDAAIKKEMTTVADDIYKADEMAFSSIKKEEENLADDIAELKIKAKEAKSLMADLKAKNSILIGQIMDNIAEQDEIKGEWSVDYNLCSKNTFKLEADMAKYKSNNDKGIKAKYKVHLELENKKKDLEYYENTDECTECRQPIDPSFKSAQLDEIKSQITKLQVRHAKIDSELKKVEAFKTKIDKFKEDKVTALDVKCKELDEKIMDLTRLKIDLESDLKVTENCNTGVVQQMCQLKETRDKLIKDTEERVNDLKNVDGIINDLKAKSNTRILSIKKDTEERNTKIAAAAVRRIDDYNKKIAMLENEERGNLKDDVRPRRDVLDADAMKKKLAFKRLIHDATIKILSDKGIKTYIIKRYLPKLNTLVNQYLDILSAPYKLSFNEELEETIALKGYDKLSYNNFSEGERQRCDVALLFAFLDIGKMKNSVTSNLLIMDEVVDRSLDDEGIVGIINILDSMKEKGFTIVNISHKHQLADKFDKTLRATKDRFSKLAEI